MCKNLLYLAAITILTSSSALPASTLASTWGFDQSDYELDQKIDSLQKDIKSIKNSLSPESHLPSRPTLDLDPNRCPKNSHPPSGEEAWGSDLLEQINLFQRVGDYAQIPLEKYLVGLPPEIANELRNGIGPNSPNSVGEKYTESIQLTAISYNKLAELYRAQDQRTRAANSTCYCDSGYKNNPKGGCMKKSTSPVLQSQKLLVPIKYSSSSQKSVPIKTQQIIKPSRRKLRQSSSSKSS